MVGKYGSIVDGVMENFFCCRMLECPRRSEEGNVAAEQNGDLCWGKFLFGFGRMNAVMAEMEIYNLVKSELIFRVTGAHRNIFLLSLALLNECRRNRVHSFFPPLNVIFVK